MADDARAELVELGAEQIAIHAAEWHDEGQIGCEKCGAYDGGDYEDHVAEAVLALWLAHPETVIAALQGERVGVAVDFDDPFVTIELSEDGCVPYAGTPVYVFPVPGSLPTTLEGD